nr:DNA mismatch repair protein MutS [Desulfobulbaceae bacterium]
MSENQKNLTPMLQQYMEIKNQHQGAILFYRLGDFYEMFFDDAIKASKILGITLTSRNSKADTDKVPLCGIPYHSSASYLAKLVRAGHKVAVCEQVEDPKEAKGIVKREVVRIITPGLVTDEQLLDDKNNLYIAAVIGPRKKTDTIWGISILDISTGEFLAGEFSSYETILDELARMTPSEILLPEKQLEDAEGLMATLSKQIGQILPAVCITSRADYDFHKDRAKELLLDHFRVANLAGFGCEQMKEGLSAAGALFAYINETQKTNLSHINKLSPIDLNDVLIIDESSRRNLEITQTIAGGTREGSLLATLDFTCTPMGARLLKKSLLFPIQNTERIIARHDTVEVLHKEASLRSSLRELLLKVYDIERLNSRIVLGSANARDLTALKHSLGQLPQLKELLSSAQGTILQTIHESMDSLTDICELLESSINEEAPVTLRDGKLIKTGYNAELDQINILLKNGKQLILDLENKEKEASGIAKLKIGFNKVFGYYFEVSKIQQVNVPDYFIRKQTLVNAERFITPELKEFENKVLGAQDKSLELEHALFCQIRSQLAEQSSRIMETASFLAELDLFASLAEAARRLKYVRPEINSGDTISISDGRHPVIECALPNGKFVPNDIHLDQSDNEVLIITGPNMAGKSTILRQTALIVLMAQVGSFVPATSAAIGVVDRIFTRVGAMDNLRQGQSTFMVEMNETANILNNATEKSLVILDEIGRGTSTFDGLSIAWAVTEELVNKNGTGVKTIFATHYHELTELSKTNKRIKNFNIGVREWNDTIIFLHKLLAGGTNRSYGIQVAALAGVPPHVIERANELLHNIEKGEFNQYGEPNIAQSKNDKKSGKPNQMALFAAANDPVHIKLENADPNQLTPMEALTLVYELKALSRAD